MKRRADVVGIFPSEPGIVRLVGAVLMEQHDPWQLQHRSMQLEAMVDFTQPANAADVLQITSSRLTDGQLGRLPRSPPR